MTGRERALLDEVAGLRDKITEWTADLVRIPTVNPYSGDDSAGCEAPGQDWIARRMRELGASVTRVPVPPDVYERGGTIGPAGRSWEGRDNVVAEWTLGDGGGPAILVNDHMDTVGTHGMKIAPFSAEVRGGKMYGRGASDTKGNLVMGLVAVEAFLRHSEGLNGRIVFESVVDEECNGGGAGTLACCLAGVRGDVVLCLDGHKGALHIGCNGIATARVVAKGRAGHSSGSDAVNAIDKGIAAKQAVESFARERQAAFPDCNINVGVFRAGSVPAIVPEEAELQINLSYDPSDAERAQREFGHWDGALFRSRFEAAMGRLRDEDPWFADHPAEVSWIKDLPPFLCDAADPLVRLTQEAASEIEGAEVKLEKLQAWFDGAHLALQLGVPVVGMGASAAGTAHSSNEYVVLDDLVAGAKAVALTLLRLFQSDRCGSRPTA